VIPVHFVREGGKKVHYHAIHFITFSFYSSIFESTAAAAAAAGATSLVL